MVCSRDLSALLLFRIRDRPGSSRNDQNQNRPVTAGLRSQQEGMSRRERDVSKQTSRGR